MILFIGAIVITAICIVIFNKTSNDIVESIALVSWAVGLIAAITMALIIIFAHCSVSVTIEQNRIEYESLCNRVEVISSDYEDVSKSDVIKDVAEWNKSVYHYKYWAYNPWTNWFYSKRIADELKPIEKDWAEVRE